MTDIETAPLQAKHHMHYVTRIPSRIPRALHLRAYEVYRHVYGEQLALRDGHCRGGFGTKELVAFLYARSFPQREWTDRMEEAFRGMQGF